MRKLERFYEESEDFSGSKIKLSEDEEASFHRVQVDDKEPTSRFLVTKAFPFGKT